MRHYRFVVSMTFIFKHISLDAYVEITNVAIFSSLWSHVFSFSIALVTILTYCIIIVIGMLMRCHPPLAYDSLGKLAIENLYLSYQSMIILLNCFHMILVRNEGAPLHVMQGDYLFSLACTFTQLWQHDTSLLMHTRELLNMAFS